jgi:hypothetical protein
MSFIHRNKNKQASPMKNKKKRIKVNILQAKKKENSSSSSSKSSKNSTITVNGAENNSSIIDVDILKQSKSFSALFGMMKKQCKPYNDSR